MGEVSGGGVSVEQVDALINSALGVSLSLKDRRFTVQDGGSDPLFSFDTATLPIGTIVVVKDLGGCGPNATPGLGLVVWMSEWRRLSRGVTATGAVGTITIDAFKDPMKFAIAGSLTTATRYLISRPYLGGLWSFVRSGLLSTASALGVNIPGALANTDVALVGPSLNLVEYLGGNLAQVQSA